MGLKNRGFGCRKVAPRLWWLSAVACACTADVDIFRSHEERTAATTAATSSAEAGTPNSTNVLVEPRTRVVNDEMNCQPGHYVGTFSGTYNSAAWGNGAPPLTIAATPSLGRPGLEFWLESIPRDCRADQEFCADFTVKGGKIRGWANPFSTGEEAMAGSDGNPLSLAVRFEIDFGGNLDCSRGEFLGLLQNGCYDLATVLFRFTGTAPADYDLATSSFTNGQWTVTEQVPADAWAQPDPNIGGMGRWQATWANDATGPAAESIGLCGPPAP